MMPWLIWRFAVVEVARLVLISTGVLVAVIAFAATVKPLADGTLGPLQALKFMGFAIPPMLAYALPFAAGFGTTLAYHRMTEDQELIAAGASGISAKKLLVPALIIGTTLAVTLGVLNEQVIPRFLRSMEQMVRLNVTEAVVRSIRSGDSARLGGMEIHADRVAIVPAGERGNAEDTFVLSGVVAVEVDRQGNVKTDATAKRAYVVVLPGDAAGMGEDEAAAVIRLEDGVGSVDGELRAFDQITTPAIRVPDPFKDDPKFLTFGELRSLKDNPAAMNFIDNKRAALARSIAAVRIYEQIGLSLQRFGRAELLDASGQVMIIRGDGLRGDWSIVPREAEQTVGIELYRVDPLDGVSPAGVDLMSAESVRLLPESPVSRANLFSATPGMSFGLAMELVTIGSDMAAADGDTNQIASLSYTALTPRADPSPELQGMTIEGLLREAGAHHDGVRRNENVIRAEEDLREELGELQNEILSKQHERMAMAAACLVMVLTGAVSAMRLGNAVPLVVYLWSFFPALATVILISSGQQTTHEFGVPGLPLLWAGVFGLALYTFVAYRAIARH